MRTALVLALATLLASPSVAEARRDGDRSRPEAGHGRGSGGGNGRGNGNRGDHGNGRGHGWGAPAPSSAPAPARSGGWYAPAPSSGGTSYRGWASAPPSGTLVRPAPYRAYASATAPVSSFPRSSVTFVPAWWFGRGWGWGYYPLFPRQSFEETPAAEPSRIATTLTGGVAVMPEAFATGFALAIEGRTAGFEAGIDAITVQGLTGDVALGSSSAIGWGTMHVTWSIVSEDAFRLRLETGGSMISTPAGGTSAGMPWAGKVAFGPDFGVSGHIGLLGPIGIEGHARVTPVPTPVTDTRAALALRGGPLAFTAGWRAIRVMGDGVDAPSVRFSGPEIGLALIF
jgi:hypothetical protein